MTIAQVEELAREVSEMQVTDDSQVQLPCETVLGLLALARRALLTPMTEAEEVD